MLYGLFVLLAFQLAGEAVTHAFHLPVPGPVVGLVGLAAVLSVLKRSSRFGFDSAAGTRVGQAATGLLGALGILFVPAGVGIMQVYRLLLDHGIVLLVVLVLSTVLSLLATVGLFLAAARLTGSRTE